MKWLLRNSRNYYFLEMGQNRLPWVNLQFFTAIFKTKPHKLKDIALCRSVSAEFSIHF